MFVELHMIQSFPPSNLNRDDVGQPKDADFGGVRRARISSQCLKRAIRYTGQEPWKVAAGKGDSKQEVAFANREKSVFEQYTGVPLAQRTKMIVDRLAPRLQKGDRSEDEARKGATQFARLYSHSKGKMDDKYPEETTVLLYLSDPELDEIARLLDKYWTLVAKAETVVAGEDEGEQDTPARRGRRAKNKEPSTLKELVQDWVDETHAFTHAPDIALFGRMLAAHPGGNVDAACQVAHAISTHAVHRSELDYYTAMDELKSRDQSGAGFLDVAYFNSACFYRYARLDVDQLLANLNGDKALACRTVEAFLRASEAAVPTGKKNSFGPECRPSFMLAVLRADGSQGWSLVNAFEKPVKADNESGLVQESVKRLNATFASLQEFYGNGSTPVAAVAIPGGVVSKEQLGAALQSGVQVGMDAWVDAICNPLAQQMGVAEWRLPS